MKIISFLTNGNTRYKIVDSENPEIVINDAQGYGFRSVDKALAFFYRQKAVLGDNIETPPDYHIYESTPLF